MAVLTVGPNGQFSTIEAAVQSAGAGDVIDVSAGTYTNDFITISQSVTLQAVGGTVDLVATASPPDGKAIIDEGGPNVSVTIAGFDISGVSVSDGNGAAVRYEGGSLTLENDTVHDNQEGLLSAADPNGTITIDNSTFYANGSGSGFTHNIYVGAIKSLLVENSTIDAAVVGHDIKSRAATTTVTNNMIADGQSGSSSYQIDLPNGGVGMISGNTIEKGPQSQNPTAVSYGEEGNLIAGGSLTVSGNTFLNDGPSSSTIAVANDSPATAQVTDNTLYHFNTVVNGPAVTSGNMSPAAEPMSNGVPCFCPGSLILTAVGEVPVEMLAVGDQVVTFAGRRAAIRWIGRRCYGSRFVAGRPALRPVVIRAGALGEGLPRRDLRVSPMHAMAIDGVLVPAGCLVNGTSVIVDTGGGRVDYLHVELDRHDLVLAEGAATESFLDDGSRGLFHNAAEYATLYPGAAEPGVSCARRVEHGYELEAIRRRIGARLGRLAA